MDLTALLRRATETPEDAISLYKTWIALNHDNPALPAAMFNLGVALSDAGDLAGAAIILRDTIRLAPSFAPPAINLGGVLERLGRRDQAIAVWTTLAKADMPITGEIIGFKTLALKQMGRLLEAANLDSAAEEALHRSLALNPDQPDAIQHLIALRQRQCKWPVLLETERLPKRTLIGAISPLSAACQADDPMFHLANAWHYCRYTIGLPPPAPMPAQIKSHGRPRIGYVSSDFREHAVGFAMTDVFETHDRDAFDIFAYDCGISTTDATRARIQRAASAWVDLNGLDDTQACRRIVDDRIDILVDLNGYTKDARTKVFAMRPTQIAVNWFGFPGTMGSPYHHYLIADEHVIPLGHERYYAEKVLRLPCYQPNDRKRLISAQSPSRQDVGLPNDAFVFCSLNGTQKITRLTFERWMIILRHVPNSVLWLLTATPDTNGRLRAAAGEMGVAPERLIFADKRANPDHLARYPLADLFLDTFPYGAHTTASDALWMGVPVLTYRGRSFAARVCSSLVHAVGLPELVCDTQNDYVVRAINLGNDRKHIAALRAHLLANRDRCTLFDTPRLVRALEDRYRDMLTDRANGCVPQPDLNNLSVYREIMLDTEPSDVELLDESAYQAMYREKLSRLSAVFPVSSDIRMWPDVRAHECFPARRA